MPSVRASVVVPADVDAVFSFMDQPANQAAVTPALRNVAVLADRGDTGKRVRHTYALGPLSFDGVVDAVAYDPPERIVWRMEGDLAGEITQTFEAVDGGTRVSYGASYEMPLPGPLSGLAPALDPVLNRANGWVLRRTLGNLRRAFAEEPGAGWSSR